MDVLFFILEIIGTIAFTISGTMVAFKKHMDILGVIVLGVTTAVGGGIIRDLILGITPPTTFIKPIYVMVAIVTSILISLPFIQKQLIRSHKFYDISLFFADSLGLGIFTVIGIKTAYLTNANYGLFLIVFVGVITGCGGGVIRDVFAQDTPYIFVKHFYCTASIIGAILCAVLWTIVGEIISMLIGFLAILILRILASKYKWHLYKPHSLESNID